MYFWSFTKQGERERDHQHHLLEGLLAFGFAYLSIKNTQIYSAYTRNCKDKTKDQYSSFQLCNLAPVYQSMVLPQLLLLLFFFFNVHLFSVCIIWSYMIYMNVRQLEQVGFMCRMWSLQATWVLLEFRLSILIFV